MTTLHLSRHLRRSCIAVGDLGRFIAGSVWARGAVVVAGKNIDRLSAQAVPVVGCARCEEWFGGA